MDSPIKKPKIIAVLPIHNGLPLVLDAISSILAQQDSSFILQIVVAACGTTDGSSEVIQAAYPEVRIVQGEESLWWTGAMKLGTTEALRLGADYIFWMNHDDILDLGTIPKLLKGATKNQNTIICSALRSPDMKSAVCGFEISFFKWYSKPKVFSLGEVSEDSFQTEANVNGGHGILIPRRVFESPIQMDVLRPDLFPHYSGDFDFFMRASNLGYKILTVGGTLISNNLKTTGMLQGQRIQKANQIIPYLFSRRSPCNLRDRPLFALAHFPIGLNIIWAGIFLVVPVLCSIFFWARKSKVGPLDLRPAGNA